MKIKENFIQQSSQPVAISHGFSNPESNVVSYNYLSFSEDTDIVTDNLDEDFFRHIEMYWSNIEYLSYECYLIEIKNLCIFEVSDAPGNTFIFIRNILSSLAVVDHENFITKIGQNKIFVIWPYDEQICSHRADLLNVLGSAVSIKEGLSIHPIFRSGYTLMTYPINVNKAYREAEMASRFAFFNNRKRVQIYNKEIQNLFDIFIYTSTKIETAFNKKELELVYQPQFDNNLQLIGFEALVRWESPDRGTIFPDDFIPILERTGQIIKLGNYIITECCLFLNKVKNRYKRNIPLALNFSPSEIENKNFINNLIAKLNQYSISPSELHIEITENILLENDEIIRQNINKLSEYGFAIYIDDFGKKYSSLSEIKDFAFTHIKIDRSFLTGVPQNKEAAKLLEAIILFCENIGFDVIVEGVENQTQLEFLVDKGLKKFQGYYFSKPITHKTAFELLDSIHNSRENNIKTN